MLLGIEKGSRSNGYVLAAEKLGIKYCLIDCNDNNVMDKIRNVDAFIWHFSHQIPREKRIFRAIIQSAEIMRKRVYPDINTSWMFDDKAYEKYLLEALEAPVVPTYLFFNANEAKDFLSKSSYPVVFKLPGGAGSVNVKLIKHYEEGVELVHKSFYEVIDNDMQKDIDGFLHKNYDLRDVYMNLQNNKGMVLFQKFLPNNMYDIRVTTIGNKNFIYNRYVRNNDFRASGSGKLNYSPSVRDLEAIPIAREISNKIGAQTMTYDFLYDENGELKICEMGYGFVEKLIHDEAGWYDENLNYYAGKINVFEEVVRMVVYGEQ